MVATVMAAVSALGSVLSIVMALRARKHAVISRKYAVMVRAHLQRINPQVVDETGDEVQRRSDGRFATGGEHQAG